MFTSDSLTYLGLNSTHHTGLLHIGKEHDMFQRLDCYLFELCLHTLK